MARLKNHAQDERYLAPDGITYPSVGHYVFRDARPAPWLRPVGGTTDLVADPDDHERWVDHIRRFDVSPTDCSGPGKECRCG